jgi:hypothetical protein
MTSINLVDMSLAGFLVHYIGAAFYEFAVHFVVTARNELL